MILCVNNRTTQDPSRLLRVLIITRRYKVLTPVATSALWQKTQDRTSRELKVVEALMGKQKPHARRGDKKSYKPPITTYSPRFKGNSHDLEGYILDCSNNKQADIFVHTLK